MTQLNEFMLIFRMEPSTEQPTPEQLQEMEQSWGAFFGSIASQGNLVSTHHLGFNGNIVHGDHSVTEGFKVAEGHMVAGNLVVRAADMQAAIEIAKTCPILYAGGTVEVRDIMAM